MTSIDAVSMLVKSTDDLTVKEQRLRGATQDFEALFLHSLLKQMREGAQIEGASLFGDSPAQQVFTDMLDQEYARVMSESGGIGFGEMLFQQLRGALVAPEEAPAQAVPMPEVASADPQQDIVSAVEGTATDMVTGNPDSLASLEAQVPVVQTPYLAEQVASEQSLAVGDQYTTEQTQTEPPATETLPGNVPFVDEPTPRLGSAQLVDALPQATGGQSRSESAAPMSHTEARPSPASPGEREAAATVPQTIQNQSPAVTTSVTESIVSSQQLVDEPVPVLPVTYLSGKPIAIDTGTALSQDEIADVTARTGQQSDGEGHRLLQSLKVSSPNEALTSRATQAQHPQFDALVESHLARNMMSSVVQTELPNTLPVGSSSAVPTGASTALQASGPIWDQVLRRLEVSLTPQQQTARVQLEPPELGRVDLRLVMRDNQLTLQIRTETGVVAEAVRTNLPDLQAAIQAKGIEVQQFDVSVGGHARDSTGNSPFGSGSHQTDGGRQAPEKPAEPSSGMPNGIDYRGSRSSVDYRL